MREFPLRKRDPFLSFCYSDHEDCSKRAFIIYTKKQQQQKKNKIKMARVHTLKRLTVKCNVSPHRITVMARECDHK